MMPKKTMKALLKIAIQYMQIKKNYIKHKIETETVKNCDGRCKKKNCTRYSMKIKHLTDKMDRLVHETSTNTSRFST